MNRLKAVPVVKIVKQPTGPFHGPGCHFGETQSDGVRKEVTSLAKRTRRQRRPGVELGNEGTAGGGSGGKMRENN